MLKPSNSSLSVIGTMIKDKELKFINRWFQGMQWQPKRSWNRSNPRSAITDTINGGGNKAVGRGFGASGGGAEYSHGGCKGKNTQEMGNSSKFKNQEEDKNQSRNHCKPCRSLKYEIKVKLQQNTTILV